MSALIWIILILGIAILVFVIYKGLKPYFLKYDKDLMLVGSPGSGKTYIGTKEGIKLLRIMRNSWWFEYKFKLKIKNFFRKRYNERQTKRHLKGKKHKPLKDLLQPIAKPQLYTWHPVHYKPHWWSNNSKREWSCKLKISHLLLLEEMTQNNVVIMDELPQAVNQFNWDLEIIQSNFNEYTSMHRHYYNNFNLITAQAPAEIVAQLRRKIGKCTYMIKFTKIRLLPLIHVECCDIITNELVSTMASTQFADNTKLMWKLALPNGTYDSRCYRNRINNIYKPLKRGETIERFDSLQTNEIVHFDKEKISPLDDQTTTNQKESMWNDYKKYLNWKGTNPSKPKGTQQDLERLVANELNITQQEAHTLMVNKKAELKAEMEKIENGKK